MGFVRKVLGIVSAQLFFSFIIMMGAAIETSPVSVDLRAGTVTCEHGLPVASWQNYNSLSLGCMNSFGVFCQSVGCQVTSIIVYIMTICALLCSRNLRHSVPINYILLFMFTLSMGFIFGGLTAYLTPGSVLLSIGVLVVTLLCIFGTALCIPAKP
jgi:FtsH-binding integral membrane protein